MPIYEFVCADCGNEFEKIVSFSAKNVPACPQCGMNQVERRIGLPALHFKGSGFYINDSKSDEKSGTKNVNGAEESATQESESGASEASDKAKSEDSTSNASSSEGKTSTQKSDSTKTESTGKTKSTTSASDSTSSTGSSKP